MRDLKAKAEVLWTYGGEVLLTIAIYWLLSHCFGPSALRRFVINTAPQWGNLAEYLFGVSAAIWIAVFASIMLTAFGRYPGNNAQARSTSEPRPFLCSLLWRQPSA